MNHSEAVHDPASQKKWRKVNVWPIKAPLLVAAVLLGIFDDRLHWGRAPIAAGIAMITAIIGYRDFWNEARFWFTVLLLGAVQVPLVIAVRPLMETYKFPLMFAFAIIDCLLVARAISWICTETK
jgi:hypothetical protein